MQNRSVFCAGLCNIDAIAYVDEAVLADFRLVKGGTKQVDLKTLETLYKKLEMTAQTPGGCAANTACAMAALSANTAEKPEVVFIGKTGDDVLGKQFHQSLTPYEITHSTSPQPSVMTSLCLTLITPDKDRSFVFCADTASWFLTADDFTACPFSAPCIFYIESYLLQMRGGEQGSNLLEYVLQQAQQNPQSITALNINDIDLVHQFKDRLHKHLNQTGIIFGNRQEYAALFGAAYGSTEFWDHAKTLSRKHKTIFVMTGGQDEIHIIEHGEVAHIDVPQIPSAKIVDTIGAGDHFAAAFLLNHAQGRPVKECCEAGISAAQHILLQAGPRLKRE